VRPASFSLALLFHVAIARITSFGNWVVDFRPQLCAFLI
jgi:hypothetical protein